MTTLKTAEHSFSIDFNTTTGLTQDLPPIRRILSSMKGMYHDEKTYEKMVQNGNPLVYEFHNTQAPEESGEIIFGTSIVYPGKVGNEYFMTKGHFHTIRDTAETYFCLQGHGYMLMENESGETEIQEFIPGRGVYVPPSYAHRSINIDLQNPLVTFFAFRADAGHDYGTIETTGFRKLVVEENHQPTVIDNPKWKK